MITLPTSYRRIWMKFWKHPSQHSFVNVIICGHFIPLALTFVFFKCESHWQFIPQEMSLESTSNHYCYLFYLVYCMFHQWCFIQCSYEWFEILQWSQLAASWNLFLPSAFMLICRAGGASKDWISFLSLFNCSQNST